MPFIHFPRSFIVLVPFLSCALSCTIPNYVSICDVMFGSVNTQDYPSDWCKSCVDPCNAPVWSGITCNNGNLTQIAVINKNMRGTFTFTLPSTLTSLDIRGIYRSVAPHGSQLRGTLDITKLPRDLILLRLGYNRFTGNIDFTKLPPKIEYFEVQYNEFTSTNGVDLSNPPTTLRSMIVESNLLSGNAQVYVPLILPHNPMNYPNWVTLFFELNQLEGTLNVSAIPPNMITFRIARNKFTGSVDWAGFPPTIRHFFLYQNMFDGSLNLEQLPPQVQVARLHMNKFTGDLNLSALSNMTTLEIINLNHQGPFNSTFDFRYLPRKLREFTLSNALLDGTLNWVHAPTTLTRFVFTTNTMTTPQPLYFPPSLDIACHIELQGNNLNGTVDFASFPRNTTYIDISQNDFTITAADFEGFRGVDYPMLSNFRYRNSRCSGHLDLSVFANGPTQVYLDTNQFTSIDWTNGSSRMTHLYLYRNNIFGNVSLGSFPNLQIFVMWSNQLNGTIDYATLPTNLRVFVANWNQLTGTVDLAALPRLLTRFEVRGNRLTGSLNFSAIPLTLATLQLDGNNMNFNPVRFGNIPPTSNVRILMKDGTQCNSLDCPIPSIDLPVNFNTSIVNTPCTGRVGCLNVCNLTDCKTNGPTTSSPTAIPTTSSPITRGPTVMGATFSPSTSPTTATTATRTTTTMTTTMMTTTSAATTTGSVTTSTTVAANPTKAPLPAPTRAPVQVPTAQGYKLVTNDVHLSNESVNKTIISTGGGGSGAAAAATVFVPQSNFAQPVRVVIFIVPEESVPKPSNPNYKVAAPIIDINIFVLVGGSRLSQLSENIIMVFPSTYNNTPVCMWQNETQTEWIPSGCVTVVLQKGIVQCSCSHLTLFTVIDVVSSNESVAFQPPISTIVFLCIFGLIMLASSIQLYRLYAVEALYAEPSRSGSSKKKFELGTIIHFLIAMGALFEMIAMAIFLSLYQSSTRGISFVFVVFIISFLPYAFYFVILSMVIYAWMNVVYAIEWTRKLRTRKFRQLLVGNVVFNVVGITLGILVIAVPKTRSIMNRAGNMFLGFSGLTTSAIAVTYGYSMLKTLRGQMKKQEAMSVTIPHQKRKQREVVQRLTFAVIIVTICLLIESIASISISFTTSQSDLRNERLWFRQLALASLAVASASILYIYSAWIRRTIGRSQTVHLVSTPPSQPIGRISRAFSWGVISPRKTISSSNLPTQGSSNNLKTQSSTPTLELTTPTGSPRTSERVSSITNVASNSGTSLVMKKTTSEFEIPTELEDVEEGKDKGKDEGNKV